MAASCSRNLRRPCIPCRNSKKGCSRDIPACQSCCERGQPDLCLYEERVPLALGYKTMPPTQPRNSKQQKAVFEVEQTHYHEWNDKTIDVQKETGQFANQLGHECQSPSTNDVVFPGDFQTSNGLIEDWTNEGEVVTSQKSSPGLVGRFPITTGDTEERPSSFGPCATQPYFDMALPVNSAVSLYLSVHG